jgi:16S rRNA (uracil1498-N3)-methyltransferase
MSISGDRITASILERARSAPEPRVDLVLVQAVPKNPKMEPIVQRCVEVGVSAFLPAVTERSIPRYSPEKAGKVTVRWQAIAMEASKQCGRGKIPRVFPATDWDGALAQVRGRDLLVMPWEGEKKKRIKDLFKGKKSVKSVAVLIGPEGGLTMEEADRAQKAGAIAVTLGPRILRTETAGLVACAILLHELGCME